MTDDRTATAGPRGAVDGTNLVSGPASWWESRSPAGSADADGSPTASGGYPTTVTKPTECQVSLHEFPFVGPRGSHFCDLPHGHSGSHHCPCGRLARHSAEARQAERELTQWVLDDDN